MVPTGKGVMVGEDSGVTLGRVVALGICVGNLMGSKVSGGDWVWIALDDSQEAASTVKRRRATIQ